MNICFDRLKNIKHIKMITKRNYMEQKMYKIYEKHQNKYRVSVNQQLI